MSFNSEINKENRLGTPTNDLSSVVGGPKAEDSSKDRNFVTALRDFPGRWQSVVTTSRGQFYSLKLVKIVHQGFNGLDPIPDPSFRPAFRRATWGFPRQGSINLNIINCVADCLCLELATDRNWWNFDWNKVRTIVCPRCNKRFRVQIEVLSCVRVSPDFREFVLIVEEVWK